MNPGLLTSIVTMNSIVTSNNQAPSPEGGEILWVIAISVIVVTSIMTAVWWFVKRKL